MATTSDTSFVHLHVASGFSMRHGSAMPADLVARAAAHAQPAVALTDRDGLYGAVRFVKAATASGVCPVLGVDLAVAPTPPAANRPETGVVRGRGGGRTPVRRTPVRGGAVVDDRAPRVVVLARGAAGGLADGAGWAALCAVVSAAHADRRGRPLLSRRSLVEHLCGAGTTPALTVLLGPDSDVGRAVLARQDTLAGDLLADWTARLPRTVCLEIVAHGGPPGTPGCDAHARAMLALADRAGVPAVLTAAVRHLDHGDAPVVDVLDAARRLVPLSERHRDRTTGAAHLADTPTMHARAHRVAPDPWRARRLLEQTMRLAQDCVQHPRRDLGIGSVHLPEPSSLGLSADTDPQQVLAERTRGAVIGRYPHTDTAGLEVVHRRLERELAVIAELGYPTYFLTVAAVVDLIRERGVRVAARGSGAGSLVNHLLGISEVDPIRHDLLMERFCSPLRAELPDIDIDVESAQRTRIYQAVLDRFGHERVTCVSMMDTYRVRHAVRDVGAALGMSPADIDEIAKAFPHIRARDARNAIADLPELRSRGLSAPHLARFFDLVEALDGLPRHVALHPCGVVLSNAGLLRRTPVEASGLGFPMSQFDKDDVEDLGLLKLDILGIRMQSAMAHAVDEIERVEGVRVALDDETQVPLDDEATFELIRSTRTLGCFQIESPGQRELIGKFGPQRFEDLIIDISLFRPGPVKSDMITPFLRTRHGWDDPVSLHPSLDEVLASTEGVVVFHEQVLRIVAITTGVDLAQADEVRRAMGTPSGQVEIESWWRPAAAARGYDGPARDRIWAVLAAFASFGFCKAHAAAFARPTYQSAWLKTHHPAAFLAGVLTHDPGMYPPRLILEEARAMGVQVLGVDINFSGEHYQVVDLDGDGHGIRLPLSQVRGIAEDELAGVLAGQPYRDLTDLWHRSGLSRPVLERIILTGGLDGLYGLGSQPEGLGRHGRTNRRDLLLAVADLERWAPRARRGAPHGQLVLAVEEMTGTGATTGLPEMTGADRIDAELDILGMDASGHVLSGYTPMLADLGLTRAADLLSVRSRSTVWVAGVKVATQTPPVRSGRRVVFLTVEDGTGPADATFFEDVQGPYAGTVFHSWLLLVRGVVRRTGPRGVSLRATGAWDLAHLWRQWSIGGMPAVHAAMARDDLPGSPATGSGGREEPEPALVGGQDTSSRRRTLVHASGFRQSPYADVRPAGAATRRLWHASPGSSGH